MQLTHMVLEYRVVQIQLLLDRIAQNAGVVDKVLVRLHGHREHVRQVLHNIHKVIQSHYKLNKNDWDNKIRSPQKIVKSNN